MRYEQGVSDVIVLAGPDPSPSPTPSCADAVDLCHYIYQQTGLPWLATSSYYLLYKPLKILLIVLLAVIARYLLHKTINRLVRGTETEGRGLLRPFRERMPNALREATGMMSE